MKKSLLLLFAASVLLACNSEPARILIKLTKGQSYIQHIVTKMSVSQKIMEKETTSLSISDMVNKCEVIDVSDSIYTLKVTYQSMSTKILVNGDSSATVKNPMSSILKELKGKSYQVKMSNSGRIVETIGADSIFKDLIAKMPSLPEELKAALVKQMSDSYGDKALKENAALGMNFYPQKSVKEGDTWNVRREGGDNLMAPKIDAAYKLDKITLSEYIISGKSTMVVGSNGKNGVMNIVIPMQYDLSGTMNSNYKIDKKTGMIKESKINQEMKGNITINSGALAKSDSKIAMSITGEIILTNTLGN
nr:DUF6263 family protein [Pedobacter panaciterrae]